MSNNILFITSNRIGDAVLTTGLLHHLVETYPSACFTIVCGPVAADLFRAVPGCSRLIVMKKKKHHRHWLDLWRACVTTRWDLIVDLRNSVVSRLLIAKKRAYRPAHRTDQHKVLDNAQALSLSPPPAPHLWLDKQALTQADAIMPKEGLPVLALGPAANWPVKQWQIEKFVELAQRLTDATGPLPGAPILITAAPHEREQVQPLLDAFGPQRRIDAIGHDLLTIGACLARCRLFIGNDSGLMHMAAASGCATLGLFGPGFETTYGPYGPRAAVVRTPESREELMSRLSWPGAFSPNLMGSLTVDAVFDAARALLDKTKDPS